MLVEEATGVIAHEAEPDEHRNEGKDADESIHDLVTVCSVGVTQVVELHEAQPNSCD